MSGREMIFVLFFLLIISNICAQNNLKEISEAAKYFKEAKSLSYADNGELWGVKLYGPMMLAYPETRLIIANEPDNENFLEEINGVFVGILPDELNIANTAFDWNGKKWTMVMMPLPEDQFIRNSLLMHELFHRIQNDINIPLYNYTCDHLDKKEGRILLRIEWDELFSALNYGNDERLKHIRSAIILNKYRMKLFPEADSLESRMLLNEGLAEYTGIKLSGAPESVVNNILSDKIKHANMIPSFVRSFAYISGPLYSFLLDKSGIDWRTNINETSRITEIIQSAFEIIITDDVQVEAQSILNDYKDSEILIFEENRAQKQIAKLEHLKEKFLSKPVLVLPLQNMSMQFNPSNLVSIENVGTVYPNIRITDNWGILNVTNDALIPANFRSVLISLPDNFSLQQDQTNIHSDDWTIELNKGWILTPSEKKGSYLLTKTD